MESSVLDPLDAIATYAVSLTDLMRDRGYSTEDISTYLKGNQKSHSITMPSRVTASSVRDCYMRTIRFLRANTKLDDPVAVEFECAALHLKESKSYKIFYLNAMTIAYYGNNKLDVDKSAIAAEVFINRTTAENAYASAYIETVRYHPLNVAYLYKVSGELEKENAIIDSFIDKVVSDYHSKDVAAV